MFTRTLQTLAVLGLVAGCNGDGSGNPDVDPSEAATIEGSVSNADGTRARLAGAGSVDAATTVKAMTVADDGSTTLVGEADVQADGSFAVDVPSDSGRVVVMAYDEADAEVGSVWVEAVGEVGSTVDAAPIDSETSLETHVMLQAFADAGADSVDTIDLRRRISTEITAAVSAGGDVDGDVQVLADAVLAAQMTRAEAFADAGLSLDAHDLFEVKMASAAALDTSLRSDQRTDATLETFLQSSLGAESTLGIDAMVASEAESQAGIAFRSVLDTSSHTELVDAGAATSGMIEAWTSSAWAEAIAADLDANAQARVELASENLRAETSASTSVTATRAAFDAFEDELLDSENGVILDLTLELPVIGLDVLLDDLVTLSLDLDSNIDADLAVSGSSSSSVATVVTDNWADFRTDVMAKATTQIFTDADLAGDLMIVGKGSFAVE